MRCSNLIIVAALFAASFTVYSSEPTVKKSKNGICHDQYSKSYKRTKKFTSYDSIDACLNSGGRLPKN